MEKDKQPWPVLNYNDLKETLQCVHLWTQIVGKIRLKQMPWLNHSWHVTLYVSSRGLTTGSVPFARGIFQIDLDFVGHEIIVRSSNGGEESVGLYSRSVSDLYEEMLKKLHRMGIDVLIATKPNEVVPAIPFPNDIVIRRYDPAQMNLLWQALVNIDVVFTRFRSTFTGKVSPVHFFWGSFDLAVTRFSGREAPKHPGGVPNIPDVIMQEAYSHEVSSCGFWPGNDEFPKPAFYSYCYPTPAEYGLQHVEPKEAFYSQEKGEFFLPYEVIQRAADPQRVLLQFLHSTYKAATISGHWDSALECNLTAFEK